MRAGDLYWYNDPYFTHGAIQHLGDMCFVAPVFTAGRLVAFAATMASSTSVFLNVHDIDKALDAAKRAALEASSTLSALLLAISLVALVAGGLVIMNLMLASVSQRSREIGSTRRNGGRGVRARGRAGALGPTAERGV